jgi:UDP-glucose:(heptosyl)LPS alpha-1,3-glucosyltransferase
MRKAAGKSIAIVYRTMSGLSGTPNTIMDHARYLSERGYHVLLIAEKVDRQRAAHAGAELAVLRRWPLPQRVRIRHFAWRADRLAARCDFVAGHGHNLQQNVLSLHNCIHLAYEKTHGHSMRSPDAHAVLQDRLLRGRAFGFCIANSELMKRDLVDRYAIPEEKIAVIYPGYHTSRFNSDDRARSRGEIRKEWGMEESRILIGIVTSGDFLKRGVDIGIDAFAALPPAMRERAMLMIVGKDSRADHFRRQIDASDLANQVRFLPPTRQIERYYHGLDVYLHPARFEEFGQSVQEAMACGLPVISCRQVGATELLPETARAALPEVMDTSSLLERLQAFIADAELRRRWAEYSLEAAAKNSDAINFEKTFALYRKAGL